MSRALDRAAAYGRIMNTRTTAAAVLGIPEVRLSLTLGTVFCMTAFAAAFIVPSAVCYAIPADVPDYLQVLVISLCLAALCAPMLAGFHRMCAAAVHDGRAELCVLFEAYASVSGWLSSVAAFLMLALRWLLPFAALMYLWMSDTLYIYVPYAAIAMLVWWRLMRTLSVAARGMMLDPSRAAPRGAAQALRHAFRFRRVYTGAVWRRVPLCCLSLLTVCVLFVFHTVPLMTLEAYLIDTAAEDDPAPADDQENNETERI